MLPEGNTFEEIFDSLKELEWSEVNTINIGDGIDVKKYINEKHKGVYKTITKLLSMKKKQMIEQLMDLI